MPNYKPDKIYEAYERSILKKKEKINEMDMKDIHDKIKNFFKNNPKPSDKDIHNLANSLDIDEHEFEEHIYMILGSLLKEDKIKGGLADKRKPSDFDPKELKMGIEIEMEHTDDEKLAKEIAMDHLVEIPDYYSRLKKMEKNAEKNIAEEKLQDPLLKKIDDHISQLKDMKKEAPNVIKPSYDNLINKFQKMKNKIARTVKIGE